MITLLMNASLLTPLAISSIIWLVLVSIAFVCPTYSYTHIFLYRCGTSSGYLFSVAILAWIFHVCRLIWRLVRLCIWHVNRRRRKVRYSFLPSTTTTTNDAFGVAAEKEATSSQDEQKSTPLLTHTILDLMAIVLLYFGLCLFAYIFWSPPTFDLQTISNDNNADLTSFPPNFTFGASTSAYQVEGNNYNNQWSRFENETGIERSGIAADMWNKFESDVQSLIIDNEHGLHLNALRISVEWSRIEPRQGQFDHSALDKYASWISFLRENGIKPMVTLHHFTNPIWFEDLGGFENDDAPSLIEPFVREVVERLGSSLQGEGVERWITINEIMVYAGNGYLIGEFPPGRRGELCTMLKVVKNMLRCHEAMYKVIKEIDTNASVSIAKNTILYHPKSHFDLISIAAAAISDVYYNAMPIRVLERQGTIDYLGLNTYIRMKVGRLGSFMGFVDTPELQSDMGWDLEPQVLYQVVKQYNTYNPELDIVITEHGVADGEMPDSRRQKFLKESLIGLAVAMNDEQIPVVGYYHWSLVDNFEWSSGFVPHFGLYHIDLPSGQARTITQGGELYREIVALQKIPF